MPRPSHYIWAVGQTKRSLLRRLVPFIRNTNADPFPAFTSITNPDTEKEITDMAYDLLDIVSGGNIVELVDHAKTT